MALLLLRHASHTTQTQALAMPSWPAITKAAGPLGMASGPSA